MCGIFGSKGFGKEPACVLESLHHRGPDANGVYKSGNLYFAHTRLSIIDPLPEANQPMEFDGLVIVFNGEIYNFKELKTAHNLECKTKSDTEAVLRLYQKFGVDAFGRLDGMFAIGIWDERAQKLVLARDQIGEKPLYYALFTDENLVCNHSLDAAAHNGSPEAYAICPIGAKRLFRTANKVRKIVFASTIESILNSKLITPTLNHQAIWDLLTFGFIPEPQTIINEIEALPKGTYLEFAGGEATISRYDDLIANPSWVKQSMEENGLLHFICNDDNLLIEQTRELVTKSITDRLMSDVPLGTFLSGGLDSSLVSIIASKKIGNLNTFNIAFDDNYDPYHGFADESPFAKEVAKQISSTHHEIRIGEADFRGGIDDFVRFADQPFGAISGLGIMAISKKAKSLGIKVLLSGDGADEIFGGYHWHLKAEFNDPNAFSADKPKGWHYYGFDSEKRRFLSELFGGCTPSTSHLITNWQNAKPKDFIDLDRDFYLPNEMMVKLDRMSMAHGIEGRAAFVSPQLLSFGKALKYEQIFFKREQKALLKAAFADIVPDFVLNREKHGFNPPIAHWMATSWRPLLLEAISSGSMLAKYHIIDNGAVFLELLDKNPVRLAVVAFSLIVLNRWLERYDSCFC